MDDFESPREKELARRGIVDKKNTLIKIAKRLITAYPQTREDIIIYVISGSLALKLALIADHAEKLSASELPHIQGETIPINRTLHIPHFMLDEPNDINIFPLPAAFNQYEIVSRRGDEFYRKWLALCTDNIPSNLSIQGKARKRIKVENMSSNLSHVFGQSLHQLRRLMRIHCGADHYIILNPLGIALLRDKMYAAQSKNYGAYNFSSLTIIYKDLIHKKYPDLQDR